MDYSNLTKEQIIDGIKNNTINFKKLPEELRDDTEIVLKLLNKNEWVLSYVSDRLKDDGEIVLAAVKNNGISLCYASERLKDDKEIVMEAVKQNGKALSFASEGLQDDKDIVLNAVKSCGTSLILASDRLQNDKDLLEFLEKKEKEIINFHPEGESWYWRKMEVLENIRNQEDKEFMEKSITSINTPPKKIKF